MSVAYQRAGYRFPIPTLSVRFRRLAEPMATEASGYHKKACNASCTKPFRLLPMACV